MELEELKKAWQAAETPIRTAYIYGAKAAKSESAVAWMKVGPIFEVVLSAIAAAWLGNFCYETINLPIYSLSGLLLAAINVFLLSTNIRKLTLLSDIDLAKPIVESQRVLTEVGKLTIWQTKWILLISPLLWGLAILVLPMGSKVDIIKHLGAPYVFGNVLFGLIFIPVGLWIVTKFSHKFKQKLADEIKGTSLVRCQTYLEELRQFELD
jgi:hypothetical protein